MFRSKTCPRCGGYLASDLDNERSCIQCGYVARGTGRSWFIPLRVRRDRVAPAPVPVVVHLPMHNPSFARKK